MRPPFSRTVAELVREQAHRLPDRPAVITREERLSYAQLHARCRKVAGALHARGVRRGDWVGLLAANTVPWLEVAIGASALGATVVPFSTWSTRPELEFLLGDAGVRVLFSVARLGGRDFAADLRALRDAGARGFPDTLLRLGEGTDPGWPEHAAVRDAAEPVDLAPGDGAGAGDAFVVLYTSGSSSRPKAVALDHHAAIENGFNIGERMGLGPDDRVLVPVPLFWSYGAINALPATLSHGAALVLQERFEAGAALELIEREACTAIYTLPAITSALLADPAFEAARTRSLRTGLTIGGPQDVMRAARELGAESICNVYGSTETYGNCCVTPHDWPLERRAACQGPPLPGMRLRLRDPDSGALAAPGRTGLVEVGGYVTRGYQGDSARFNGQAFDSQGYFRTGDLARIDEGGALVFAGRSTEMIKRSGINVSPAEVEEVLLQHPCVAMAGVTGTPHAELGEAIVAFVVWRAGEAGSLAGLAEHCRAQLSRYKLPDRIEAREALPLTPTGKLLRKELKALAEEPRGD